MIPDVSLADSVLTVIEGKQIIVQTYEYSDSQTKYREKVIALYNFYYYFKLGFPLELDKARPTLRYWKSYCGRD